MKCPPDYADVKNPSEGSLGMPDIKIIREVRKRIPQKIPLSVAIGDAAQIYGAAFYKERARAAVHAGADIIKVGLYGFANKKLMLVFLSTLKKAVGKTPVVAALYADLFADFIGDFPTIAESAGIHGCLLDTYKKDAKKGGKKLTDYLSPETLGAFAAACRKRGLLSALAGGLDEGDIEWLMALKPRVDVVGFRGAVCKGPRGGVGLDAGKMESIRRKIAGINLPAFIAPHRGAVYPAANPRIPGGA